MEENKTYVLITIDTEFSMGGFFKNPNHKPVPADRIIYCRKNGREYGISLIMDILDQYGLKGVFFVETENRFYFGKQVVLDIIHTILQRGHEIQLHTHPNFRSFVDKGRVSDDMRTFDLEFQKIIISEALSFLKANGITDIRTHRSGGFYSNQDTLRAQFESGLYFSSNYNLAFPNCTYTSELPFKNDIYQIANNFYEVPITCFHEKSIFKNWNSFQLAAASSIELEKGLKFYHSYDQQVVTFLSHSFEFIKPTDEQFTSFNPLWYRINRFTKFCKFLSENLECFEVITFNNLKKLLDDGSLKPIKGQKIFYRSSHKDILVRYLTNKLGNLSARLNSEHRS